MKIGDTIYVNYLPEGVEPSKGAGMDIDTKPQFNTMPLPISKKTGATIGLDLRDSNSAILKDEDVIRFLRSVYGDGDDGDLSTTGDVSLIADTYYGNLTINSGHTVKTDGYRLFVKGTLTIKSGGSIGWPGNDGGDGGNGTASAKGDGGTAGAVLTANFLYGALAGKAGGDGGYAVANGSAGTAGDNGVAVSLGSNGSAGGAGGAGNGGAGAAGAGGTEGAAATYGEPHNVYFAINMISVEDSTDPAVFKGYTANAGAGSGGGGGNGSESGGDFVVGGGGGGGSASSAGTGVICARTIVNHGTINFDGGDGGDGGDGSTTDGGGNTAGGGGGGGGGGNGGVCLLVYNSYSGSGTKTVAAGAGGAAGAAGVGTGGAANGNAGSAGAAGSAGLLIEIAN